MGVLGAEPVYWIERLDPAEDGADVQLGFSDVAAHPFHGLVEATVGVLAGVPGVVAAWQEDRELVLVQAPGVAPEQLADVVDRFWLDALTRTGPDPSYGWEPDPSRPLPTSAGPAQWSPASWPADSPAQPPAPSSAPSSPQRPTLRDAVSLPPSAGRMWLYLVCGAIPAVGGLALALTPGGSNGVLALGVGVVNLVVGARIALRRRALGL